ncbi:hypothetical protein K2224_36740 (plasmid) [Streptomyces sp. BHT-5-2]|uniref:hypothetical protein n=1 Tax=unclassified Streptomyces TaxID=2593676 RepID=UPI001C8EBF68|nr:hypothetical protein [Streptomyces sp. BHT-5-2]QZL08613.1 hypothetical protein K2224_36740 [Streptomyces sp. BHT-5-2]
MGTSPAGDSSGDGADGFDLGNLFDGFGSGLVGMGPYGLAPFRDFGSLLGWF